MKLLLSTLFILASISWSGTASAAGPDMQEGMWEITSKVSMPNMPMQMPASTVKICFNKDDVAKTDKTVPKAPEGKTDQKCDMVEQKMVGNKFSYKMVCTGKDKMTMEGEITYAKTSYQGLARMEMVQNGQAMKMTTEYSAKRVGDCTK